MSVKNLTTFVFLLFLWHGSIAQAPWLQSPDSLKKVLEGPIDDETRLQVLFNLTARYLWSKPDSAVPYAQQYLLLAQKKRSDSLMASAYSYYSGLAQNTGNFAQALEYGFKALAIAERTRSSQLIAEFNNAISNVYLGQGDIERCISYARQALDILATIYTVPKERPTSESYLSDTYASTSYTLCKAYVKNGQPDSVLKYIKPVEWIWGYQWQGSRKKWPTVPLTYGHIEYLKGNYKDAIRYYTEGVAAAEYWDVKLDMMDNLNGLAKSHRKMNQLDSAAHYARRVLHVSRTAQNPIIKMEALTLLSDIFKKKNDVDSSAKYFELTLASKDSLFNQSRIIEIQNSTFNEQLRQQEIEEANTQRTNRYRLYSFGASLMVLVIISVVLYRSMQVKQKAKEKVEKAFGELKATQAQLIHAEKMASLGELTAGIAHEIQNPLNFVNNFSDLNKELVAEMTAEVDKGNIREVKTIAKIIADNEEKISHHGKRADAIVKGMLQHSRSSSITKEPTTINALVDEYLRLAYHGFRAKDKSFNVEFKSDLDEKAGTISIIPQEIGRVVLNLINNAFYAVNEKQKQNGSEYQPKVTVRTKRSGTNVLITVKDNGNGIPQKILDKIFQPFFTTKPVGQGTGLGLSLSYDIVKAHGGELTVQTREGEGSEFTISLP